MVIALAGFVTAGALPAGAAPSTVDYVALGDSYAAGTAATGSSPNCPHGAGGYPALLDDGDVNRIDLTTNAACSGATTSYVVKHELSALERDTRLVTLTVGAANLGLSTVLTECTTGTPDRCQAAILLAKGLLGDCADDENSLYGSLRALYIQVAGKAPGARIVVTGYPLLFDPSAANVFPFSAINDATAELNCIIERAVAAAKDADVNIRYVDVTEEFATHGIVDPRSCIDLNAPSAFIHTLCDRAHPDRLDLEAFHPTPAGYRAFADAISAALPGGWLLST
jgi:lysophospholipase L1-like esterase